MKKVMNLKSLKKIKIVQRIYRWLVPGELDVFPSLDENLEGVQHYLKGRVLNAGSGIRDVSHLINSTLSH